MKKRTIHICGEEWDLVFDDTYEGGKIEEIGTTGKGKIVVGRSFNDWYKKMLILHEVSEAVYIKRSKRYEQSLSVRDNDYMFVFTHDDLDSLIVDILEGLLSSGEFK